MLHWKEKQKKKKKNDENKKANGKITNHIWQTKMNRLKTKIAKNWKLKWIIKKGKRRITMDKVELKIKKIKS